ncbi:MAG: site-2 protease family protein [Candidatus Margulisiibacteriota bacterium]|jgi:Zn-dependent protease
MKKTFKVLTLFDIPVEINYTWFIVFALVIFTLAGGYFPETDPGLNYPAYLMMAVVSSLLLFTSLLAHEFSHSVVAMRNDLPIHGITLFIFGGIAHLEKEPETPWVEFKMAIAGPLMSFGLGLFFFFLTQLLLRYNVPSYVISMSNYLFIVNLAVALFNLIPGFPLDGGRVLRSILWKIMGNLSRATRIASGIGRALAFLIMAYGFFLVFAGLFLNGLWFIFIGYFVQESAEASYRQVLMRRFLSGTMAKNIMSKELVTVPPTLAVDRLVNDYFLKLRYISFPVIEDDNLLGIVTVHLIKELDQDKWPQYSVRDVMIPVSDALVIQGDAQIMECLAKMTNNEFGRLLVVEGEKLVGIISQRDIMRLLDLRSKIEK